jgi:cellulose biosynthesis protein BcsQ
VYVITFYSFKGGVGRTMALVNVAAQLVKMGRKVLVVDFDLEAPGLETYKHLKPKTPHAGLVEYVTEFMNSAVRVPDIRDFVFEAEPVGDKGGRLFVMPAGRRDAAYRRALVNLNWKRLYHEREGFLFFEETKKAWEEEFKPDYVLIDSRTGDTDVLGICTRQLPDSVVFMFAPNEQNLAGLENVCRDIRREETDGLKKKIILHFVAANVPNLDDEKQILRRQLQQFRKRLEFNSLSGIIRRYENLDLLDQRVYVIDRRHSRLARAYRRLTQTLVKDNFADRNGALLFLRDYAKRRVPRIDIDARSASEQKLGVQEERRFYPDDSDAGAGFSSGKDPLEKIAGNFLDDVEIFNKIAECYILEEDFKKATDVLGRVLQLSPRHAGAFFWRGLCKIHLPDQKKAAADDFLDFLRLSNNDIYALRCLCKLRDIAPERLSEAVSLLDAKTFPAIRIEIAKKLSGREEGIPAAAQILRELVGNLPKDALEHEQEMKALLGPELYAKTNEIPVDHLMRRDLVPPLLSARCWREVIDLLELNGVNALNSIELFYLALAYWGEKGEMPVSLCQLALQRNGAQERLDFFMPEAKSWVLWRLGRIAEAIQHLDEVERSHSGTLGDIFSLWQCREVASEQYRKDCESVRRMFKGERTLDGMPLRPTFLGSIEAPPDGE